MENGVNPKVSIILPTYNRAHLLPRAIGSCLNQTFKDIEILVVDDSSSDNTGEVVGEYRLRDQRVKYIRNHANLGAAGALNAGIENSRGAFITFIDDDSEYLPERIETRLAMAEYLTPMLALIYGNVWNETVGGGTVYPSGRADKFVNAKDVLEGDYFFTGQMTCFARRDFMLKYKFDENLRIYQDVDLLLRAILNNEKVYYFDRPLGIHHNEFGMSDISTRNITEKEKFILKHKIALKRYPSYLSRLYYCQGKDSKNLNNHSGARKYFLKAFLSYPARIDYLFKAFAPDR